MIRLAFAIGFLAVFGMIAVWLISYWKKNSNDKQEKRNVQNKEN